MSGRSIQSIINRLAIQKYKKQIIHIGAWVLLFCFLVSGDLPQLGWPQVIYQNVVDVLFYALVIYANLLYLIPRYLSQKKFIIYVLFLLLLIVVLTPIKIFIKILMSNEPDFQMYFVQNQFYFFLYLFLVAVASTLFSIFNDWMVHQRDRIELESRTMQSELNFLRSQINPHFLFNTLNNLYALTLKKSDDAPQIVLKLSEMMRYMLYECNERRVLLSKELSYIKNYLDLERLRQPDKVDIQFEVKGHIFEQKIAPLLLIPFIENSFKHGLNNQILEGFVLIELTVDNQRLEFKISNSKAPSQPKSTHRKSGGIGLVNVRRRLNLIYPGQYDLDIRNEPDVYTVILSLNLDS